jgi:hypothetical protein
VLWHPAWSLSVKTSKWPLLGLALKTQTVRGAPSRNRTARFSAAHAISLGRFILSAICFVQNWSSGRSCAK